MSVLIGRVCPARDTTGPVGLLACRRLAATLSRMTADRTGIDPAFAEFVDLWGAATADALHRVLVLHQPFRSTADAFEPFQLLAKHHEEEPQTSTVTALLLLTDPRWSKSVSRLVREIAGSGMISDDDLDLLARTFVTGDEYVYWRLPEAWLGDDQWTEIDLGDSFGEPTETGAASDEEQPTVAARRVYPPLRRWAATHLVARDATTWGALFSTAHRRGGRFGAAVMAGLLDAIDYLTEPAQKLIIDTAVDWPQAGVRKRALGLLADRGNRQAAYGIARRDASKSVRRWAPALLEPPPAPDATPDPASSETLPQGQLFPG